MHNVIRDPFFSIMSETKDSNTAALDGNPEPMDQSEDNSMPSAQQQVIYFLH